jgi:hypothetical protein
LKGWKAFHSELHDLYPDTAAGKRYTKTGLQEFVRISARRAYKTKTTSFCLELGEAVRPWRKDEE